MATETATATTTTLIDRRPAVMTTTTTTAAGRTIMGGGIRGASLSSSTVADIPLASSAMPQTVRGLGYTTREGAIRYGESQVISERVVEHEVVVPRKVIREDIVERVIVVPEKVVHEEVVEDLTTVRQRVVEVAKPVIQERIVEVPEIEFVQRVVEVPEILVQQKIREVPKIEVQERIIEIPRIVEQQRVVEVPEIEYIEVPVERVIEVPEVHEQIVIKQIPVPQYVEKSVPEVVNVEVTEDISRQVPIPLEAITTVELKVPRLRPRYTKHDIPLYVPRFIEVAMPAELMDASAIAEAEHYAQQVTLLASQSAASLCEVERLAGALKELDGHYANMAGKAGDFIGANMAAAWGEGRLTVDTAEIAAASSNHRQVGNSRMVSSAAPPMGAAAADTSATIGSSSGPANDKETGGDADADDRSVVVVAELSGSQPPMELGSSQGPTTAGGLQSSTLHSQEIGEVLGAGGVTASGAASQRSSQPSQRSLRSQE